MILGDIQRFAIEYEIKEDIDDWIFGCFFFWINGIRFGNAEDTVDLNGCASSANRLIKLNQKFVNRRYFEMCPVKLISKIGDLSEVDTTDFKYHVDFIGMTSFDRNKDTFILVKDHTLNERIVYNSTESEPGDVFLARGEFEHIVVEFIKSFRSGIVV